MSHKAKHAAKQRIHTLISKVDELQNLVYSDQETYDLVSLDFEGMKQNLVAAYTALSITL